MFSALAMICEANHRAVRLRVLQSNCGMLLRCHAVRITCQKEAIMPVNGPHWPLCGVCVCVCVCVCERERERQREEGAVNGC